MRQSLEGWKLYLRQPIFPASAAYIMLFFNAVLGPGSLMTAFLASKGLSGTGSAIFRWCCRPAPPCQDVEAETGTCELYLLVQRLHAAAGWAVP